MHEADFSALVLFISSRITNKFLMGLANPRLALKIPQLLTRKKRSGVGGGDYSTRSPQNPNAIARVSR